MIPELRFVFCLLKRPNLHKSRVANFITPSPGEIKEVKKLIENENPRKPMSDNKISAFLVKEGINVARRTVAKYREAMMIPPSNERKELT